VGLFVFIAFIVVLSLIFRVLDAVARAATQAEQERRRQLAEQARLGAPPPRTGLEEVFQALGVRPPPGRVPPRPGPLAFPGQAPARPAAPPTGRVLVARPVPAPARPLPPLRVNEAERRAFVSGEVEVTPGTLTGHHLQGGLRQHHLQEDLAARHLQGGLTQHHLGTSLSIQAPQPAARRAPNPMAMIEALPPMARAVVLAEVFGPRDKRGPLHRTRAV
jgi:hypothetical protein